VCSRLYYLGLCKYTFAQRGHRLTTHFSEPTTVVKRRIPVYSFLLSRNLQIRCLNFYGVCTCRSELKVAPQFKNSINKIPSLSQHDVRHDLTRRSLRLEFVPAHPHYSPDLAPSSVHHTLKDALFGRRFADDGELTTPCVNMSEGSAKNFRRFSFSVSSTGGKSVL